MITNTLHGLIIYLEIIFMTPCPIYFYERTIYFTYVMMEMGQSFDFEDCPCRNINYF